MTHEKEIKRWSEQPDGTKVWWKQNLKGDWALVDPSWRKDYFYIVDDEWAELRKAQLDGKKVFFRDTKVSPFVYDGPLCFDGEIWQYVVEEDIPKPKWQWLCIDQDSGLYDVTREYYKSKEKAQVAWPFPWLVVRSIEESEKWQ